MKLALLVLISLLVSSHPAASARVKGDDVRKLTSSDDVRKLKRNKTRKRDEKKDPVEFVAALVAASDAPSDVPSSMPSDAPSSMPSDAPSSIPSDVPSTMPSDMPSVIPIIPASVELTSQERRGKDKKKDDKKKEEEFDLTSGGPVNGVGEAEGSDAPSDVPSFMPSATPSDAPSFVPSLSPSSVPSDVPSSSPSALPSHSPSEAPSLSPSSVPSAAPSVSPTIIVLRENAVSAVPSMSPSVITTAPTKTPTPPSPELLTPTGFMSCGSAELGSEADLMNVQVTFLYSLKVTDQSVSESVRDAVQFLILGAVLDKTCAAASSRSIMHAVSAQPEDIQTASCGTLCAIMLGRLTLVLNTQSFDDSKEIYCVAKAAVEELFDLQVFDAIEGLESYGILNRSQGSLCSDFNPDRRKLRGSPSDETETFESFLGAIKEEQNEMNAFA